MSFQILFQIHEIQIDIDFSLSHQMNQEKFFPFKMCQNFVHLGHVFADAREFMTQMLMLCHSSVNP